MKSDKLLVAEGVTSVKVRKDLLLQTTARPSSQKILALCFFTQDEVQGEVDEHLGNL